MCYPVNTMVATRHEKDDKRTCFGIGENNDPQFTLSGAHEHGVIYADADRADGAINATDYKGIRNQDIDQEKYIVGRMENETMNNEQQYIVRRLTPTECARLQGMPDWWVDGIENADPTEEEMAFWREVWETYRLAINPKAKPKTDKQIRKWLANPRSDAAEYKMWGNGMALPCVLYVMEGVTKYLNEIKQEEHNDPDN